MFTGIVEELGEVSELTGHGDSAVLTVRSALAASDLRHGASICVNGVCLTVVAHRPLNRDSDSETDTDTDTDTELIDFDVMAETLKRSVIGALKPGERVNLERA